VSISDIISTWVDGMPFRICFLAAMLIGSSAVCLNSQAENICNETPPANRAIDGIPAYAQCTTSTNSSIYSNNGVDTRTTSGGTGWVKTQGGGGYQCTEFAHRYLYFHWNIKSVPGGNAGTWGDDALPNGLVKTTTPVHGDIIVFAPGSCGAGATTGHVAVVDLVNGTSLTIVEQNGASRRTCKASCARWFLHAQVNTGVLSSPDVLAAADLSVTCAKKTITIRLNRDFTTAASVRVYNLHGQLIADLTNRQNNGKISFETGTAPSQSLIVSVRKGNRMLCRRVLVTE
jgi:surface antigen